MIDSLHRGSQFFFENPPRARPSFKETELQLGQQIGNGQFGMVCEVTGFSLGQDAHYKSRISRQPIKVMEERVDEEEFPVLRSNDETRYYMNQHVLRDGAPRFAVKRVRLDLTDERKGSSAIDLAVESKFLASIDHSNIIKLRGTVSSPGYDSFMIVLDRLYSILNMTIERWKKEARDARGPLGFRLFKKLDHYKAKTERLVCLYDIARAIKHLHSLKILYRDLKPEYVSKAYTRKGGATLPVFGSSYSVLFSVLTALVF